MKFLELKLRAADAPVLLNPVDVVSVEKPDGWANDKPLPDFTVVTLRDGRRFEVEESLRTIRARLESRD